MDVKEICNTLVRLYLYHWPITEGKKQLLSLTRGYILPREKSAVIKTRHGFYLRLTLKNEEHQRMYFYGEHDERYEIMAVARLLRPGDVCWDMGANIGFYTCLFATLAGEGGRVVSFEPVSATMDKLRMNVELNQFRNVTLRRAALGDAKGPRAIYLNSMDAGEGTASLRFNDGRALSEPVTVEVIDEIRGELPSPEFIKVDVEGCLLEVIMGMEGFFKDASPMILAEVKDERGGRREALEGRMKALGYSFYEFGKGYLKHCQSLMATKKRNVLMVKEASPLFERVRPLIQP